MKRLKKYFKLPPKNVCIIYGVAIAVILIAFLSVYFTFGKQLTAFVSDTQNFNAWLAQYKSLSAVIFILIRAFQTVIKIIPAEPLEIQFKQLKIISNSDNQNLFLWIFYLVPGTPKDIFTYIVSSTDINLVRFFAITTIARIPSIITSTICGNELMHNNMKTAATVFVLTAVLSGICAIIYKKHNDKKMKAA